MSQLLEDMQFGTSITAPHDGWYWDVDERGNIIGACAIGAALVGEFVRKNGRMPNQLNGDLKLDFNYNDEWKRYLAVYGATIVEDNDELGRDVVLQRLKEMEASD